MMSIRPGVPKQPLLTLNAPADACESYAEIPSVASTEGGGLLVGGRPIHGRRFIAASAVELNCR
jgi:hypothetical protein